MQSHGPELTAPMRVGDGPQPADGARFLGGCLDF